jgi:hypothetical protein
VVTATVSAIYQAAVAVSVTSTFNGAFVPSYFTENGMFKPIRSGPPTVGDVPRSWALVIV